MLLLSLRSVLSDHHPDDLDARARSAHVAAVDRAARSGPQGAALLHTLEAPVKRLPRLRLDAASQLREETAAILAASVADWLEHEPAQQQNHDADAAEAVLLLLAFWIGGRRLPLPEWAHRLRDSAVAAGSAQRGDAGVTAANAVYLAAYSASPAASPEHRETAWLHAARLVSRGSPIGLDLQSWRAPPPHFPHQLPTSRKPTPSQINYAPATPSAHLTPHAHPAPSPGSPPSPLPSWRPAGTSQRAPRHSPASVPRPGGCCRSPPSSSLR